MFLSSYRPWATENNQFFLSRRGGGEGLGGGDGVRGKGVVFFTVSDKLSSSAFFNNKAIIIIIIIIIIITLFYC